MKIENSSDEETNLRLLRDAREEVVRLRGAIGLVITRMLAGDTGAAVDATKELSNLRKAMTQAIEVETYLAKRSDETRRGGEGACPLDLDAARREILDRLAKIAAAR